ncbi:MAG: PEP-CTERM sorting domain-containing protein [Phenylobacterium sp.]|uniref:PEPxxWA-CTERM sorting domain-containing protein n=1 Tax=Phenylobacterium sp. TaxID=1871053 RepID=UPI0011F8DDE8|nr:PEPxxWA-CTERM sorting domain-containing protein [Phenylobacterium sp.]TAJ70202.1 MAG: PEP-CTERM sorting domain-containing protein [Phenylobacterium sp.]
MRKLLTMIVALSALPAAVQAANLIQNGSFEESTSAFTTPPGWFNIGHTEGVLSYATLGLPAFDGDYVYVTGGASSNGFLSVGEGIGQTVSTTAGDIYQLSFGYTGENCPGCSTVFTLNLGAFTQDFTITADDSGYFRKAFTVATVDPYIATGGSTTLSFVLKSSTNYGNNDPIFDQVVLERIGAINPGAAPEPATWATMILGLGASGAMLRRRRRVAA